MMDGLRRAGQTLIGRIVVAILFGFLILSFGVWGVADMIRNVGHLNVATVGSAEIGVQAYRDAYQNELQSLSRRVRRPITNDEARALGLEQQVLSKLITEAALDQRVRDMRLAISDEAIAKAIIDDQNFKGSNGQFDRNRFNELVRASGYTELGFVKAQRAVYLRQQLAEAVAGAMSAPLALRDAVHRFQNETRAVDYVVLGADRAGDPGVADEARLKAFFDQRKTAFRAPEYRKVNVVVLAPGDVSRPEDVSEADAKATYERTKERYGQPERRIVRQIVFPTMDEAKAASDRIKGGATFQSIAEERKLKPADTDLGLVTRDAIIDPKVAETAFALNANSVSDPVDGRFGAVIVDVGEVQPESVKSFESVAGEIRAQIAASRSRDAVQDMHDKIEDQRASARPLAEIARELKLKLRSIEGLDRAGRDKAEKPVDLPDRDTVLRAIFASDIGADNESISTKDGGWVWFEITGIEPPRDRSLEEVKDEVARQWRDDEIANRVADKASEIVKKVNAGTALSAVAAELGLELKTATGIKRQGADAGLPPAAVAQAFGTPVGSTASAIGATGLERVVLTVTSAEVPPLLSTQQQTVQLEDQIRVALGDDILNAYVGQVQKDLGVSINEAVLRQAIGGGS